MGRGGGRGGGGGGRALFSAARGSGRGAGRLSGLARNTRGLFSRGSARGNRALMKKFLERPGKGLARFNNPRLNAGQRTLANRAKKGYEKYSYDVASGKSQLSRENYSRYLTDAGVNKGQQEAIKSSVEETMRDLIEAAQNIADAADAFDDDSNN